MTDERVYLVSKTFGVTFFTSRGPPENMLDVSSAEVAHIARKGCIWPERASGTFSQKGVHMDRKGLGNIQGLNKECHKGLQYIFI